MEWFSYGGDFDDYPNDRNFCIDGLNFPDRKPHTGLLELKKILEPLETRLIDSKTGEIAIHNRYFFKMAESITGYWKVIKDGEILQQGILSEINIPPQGTQRYVLPYSYPSQLSGSEYWLEISYHLDQHSPWAPRGHELANVQFPLPGIKTPPKSISLSALPKIKCELDKNCLYVSGDNFRITFDAFNALLCDWKVDNQSIVSRGPKLNIWRAPTDNDVNIAREWQSAGFDRLLPNVRRFEILKQTPQAIVLESETIWGGYSVRPAFKCTHRYTIYGSGDLLLDTTVNPMTNLPVLPRIGIVLYLPGSMDRLTWYGRGPHENYSDRKESAFIGVYSNSIKDEYVPYIYPQEFGNKSDVRWMVLNDLRGAGMIVMTPPDNSFLNISVHEYTAEELTRAKHTHELHKNEDTILNIDHLQAGLGSNSCGPGPLSKYLVEPKEYHFSIRIRHFDRSTDNPWRVFQQDLEKV